MNKSYLISKNGQITKEVVRPPLKIDEALLQKLFPNLPNDETETEHIRAKFFVENQDVLSRLYDAVNSYYGNGFEESEDPKGKATPEWDKATVMCDNGTAYRWLFKPIDMDLESLQLVAKDKDCEMPPEISERLRSDDVDAKAGAGKVGL